MDLRDEVAGTEGTIWLNHFLRTGFEAFRSGAGGDYVAEKAETASGWLFPVGDEVSELGYVDMFTDMFDAMDEGRAADGDVLRRLRRQRDHRRLLPLRGKPHLGAGSHRRLARTARAADRAQRARARRQDGDQGGDRCRTAAAS